MKKPAKKSKKRGKLLVKTGLKADSIAFKQKTVYDSTGKITG